MGLRIGAWRANKRLVSFLALTALVACIATSVPAGASAEAAKGQLPKTVVQYKSELRAASKLTSLPSKLLTPLDSVTNKNILYTSGCHSMGNEAGANPKPCVFGNPNGKLKIWLIGDSHASQWFQAIDAFAKKNDANLTVHTKSSCPIMLGLAFYPNTTKPYLNCQDYNDWIAREVADAAPDLLIVANYQGLERLYVGQVSFGLDRLASLAKRVVLLGDTPKQIGLLPPCLKKRPKAIQECQVTLGKAYFPQVTNSLRETVKRNGFGYIDPRSWFCTREVCPPVIANRVIYADATHISTDAANYFANRMSMALTAQIAMLPK